MTVRRLHRALPWRPISLVGALVLAPVLYAQSGSTETQRLRTSAEQAESSEAAAAAARDNLGSDGVTFDDVLGNPDDIDLNFRFAKAEIQRGNLRSAAGTLERVLLLAPERTDVRLIYAIVLFRLNSLLQAKAEFTTLSEAPLSPAIRNSVDDYLREIELRSQRTRYYVQGSFGFNYDLNRNSGPDNHRVLIGNNVLSVANTNAARENDVAATATVIGGFTHRLDSPTGDKAFGRAGWYHGEQATLSSFDIDLLFGEVGRDFNTSFGRFTTKVFGSAMRLSHQNFLNSVGGEVRFDHKVNDDIRLYEAIRGENQNFQPIGENVLADNEDGMFYNVTFGMHMKASPTFLIDAHARINVKNAKQQFEAYEGPEFGSTFTWLLGDGMFGQLGANFRVDTYNATNNFISTTVVRKDSVLRLRGTLGVPLASMIGAANEPDWLTGSLVTFGLGYTHSASSLPNFDYYNTQFSAALNKRWDF
ncbi:MAG: hypothetical protein AAF458_00715 [Pseudomonadota bacterium]